VHRSRESTEERVRAAALNRESAAQQLGAGAAPAVVQATVFVKRRAGQDHLQLRSGGGRVERARALVHDDVSFEGPIDSFSDADSYIASLRQLAQIMIGAAKQKVFVDGDDVCVIYDLKTMPVPSSRTCEWYRVRDGKVASVSVVFDARPFAPLFEARQAE
jgi:hypothetical protein